MCYIFFNNVSLFAKNRVCDDLSSPLLWLLQTGYFTLNPTTFCLLFNFVKVNRFLCERDGKNIRKTRGLKECTPPPRHAIISKWENMGYFCIQ